MSCAILLDKLIHWIMLIGLPVVQYYHCLCDTSFLTSSAEDARGVEKIANYILAPMHYLLCGQEAKKIEEAYTFKPRFSYGDHFLLKTATAFVVAPLSICTGTILKAVAYLDPETQRRHLSILQEKQSRRVCSNLDFYRAIGMNIQPLDKAVFIPAPSHERRPGDERHMQQEKEALREIVAILKSRNIPFWVDCGTCLGAYRYGGVIPWDWDLDIAVLEPDFENVKHALNALDREKYVVQDWSGRDQPCTYLKVYVKGTPNLIDIYHFSVDPVQRTISSIFSNEESPFLPESWKIRERRYSVATSFELVFPLKRANFDGIQVPVPGRIVEYLQQRYGSDISPAKVYDPLTGRYEKDLSHPYWRTAHVH